MKKKKQLGQAMIEYLIIFSFLALVSIQMVQGVAGFVQGTIGNLAYYLTQQLSVGVCEKECYFSEYSNKAANP